jgi:hypothetical protein
MYPVLDHLVLSGKKVPALVPCASVRREGKRGEREAKQAKQQHKSYEQTRHKGKDQKTIKRKELGSSPLSQ